MTIFKGATVEAAIEAGLSTLQLNRDHAQISVEVQPRRGFLGIGKRLAEVNITKVAKSTEKSNTVKKASNEPKTVSQEKATPSSKHTRSKSNEQAVAELEDYLADVIEQLGVDATSDTELVSRQVTIRYTTEDEGLLIGKHGRTINALQSLAQIYLNHKGAAHLEVELDVSGYRERRAETLTRLADNMAREVVASGKPVYLDPMPAFERKQIHSTLGQNHHVITYSAGKEPRRAVVIAPKL
ncbi:RNA-binding protein [Secundilactobacillus oryzae JCM 18671]|uniref:RNA-binding protein KhpB n=1 Tax=Secundilactobacillus oryzae JCM 18671 TaxID=1291743 RepID=A0A081BHH7_9LACO|nr:RNA-binding cell elongation regulator Jag/EloR [Secundilactobacillus oryzae]GAK47495.1 RNA-binding protein [Secundilactobacillus oryzae JCM 18671]